VWRLLAIRTDVLYCPVKVRVVYDMHFHSTTVSKEKSKSCPLSPKETYAEDYYLKLAL
jgi:hypothetical protein